IHSYQPLIRFTDVSLGYGDFTVLRNIDLEAKRGQVVAMMGGSGSGKTTLLRAATAEIFAQTGTIEVFDKDLDRCSPREIEQLRKRMGVLFSRALCLLTLMSLIMWPFPYANTPSSVMLKSHASYWKSSRRWVYAQPLI